jgi:hypothetical protein
MCPMVIFLCAGKGTQKVTKFGYMIVKIFMNGDLILGELGGIDEFLGDYYGCMDHLHSYFHICGGSFLDV